MVEELREEKASLEEQAVPRGTHAVGKRRKRATERRPRPAGERPQSDGQFAPACS